MITPGLEQWRVFGVAVARACEEAARAARPELPGVTAEELFLAEGRCARFGHPLSCGRLPVAVAGLVCLITRAEAERYWAEFAARQG